MSNLFVHDNKIIKNQSFDIVFTRANDIVQCEYKLHESIIASNWYRKITHLKQIPIDPIESYMVDLSNIRELYSKFCDYTQIDKDIDLVEINQEALNQLHVLYETHHDTLCKYPNNEILYQFHKSIHYHEIGGYPDKFVVGWGKKEGPVSYEFLCNPYYEQSIQKNNLYLSWIELGKRPSDYYKDKEPNSQKRINKLCKPHITFAANFFIAYNNEINTFDEDFEKWFSQFKSSWCKQYGLSDWTAKDEYSAPLLATPNHNVDVKEIVQDGYKFDSIRLSSH